MDDWTFQQDDDRKAAVGPPGGWKRFTTHRLRHVIPKSPTEAAARGDNVGGAALFSAEKSHKLAKRLGHHEVVGVSGVKSRHWEGGRLGCWVRFLAATKKD